MTTRPSHATLVEEVAAVLCNLDEDQPPDAEYGRRIMSHAESPHRGDCTKEPFTCVRCLYTIEAKRAETVLSIIAARLSDVTPEMVEAWFVAAPTDMLNATDAERATADWRAMLAASPLTPGDGNKDL